MAAQIARTVACASTAVARSARRSRAAPVHAARALAQRAAMTGSSLPAARAPRGARATVRAASDVVASAEGPVAIVTGASRGIGRSVALELAKHGCRVLVNYAGNEEAANATAADCKAAGGDAITFKANIASQEEVQSMFKAAMDEWGRVDVVVNNAGITRDTLMMRMKPDMWNDVINTNLTGVFYCCQEATKIMRKQRAGRIINLASVVGLVGNVGQANYSAAKGGVIALTKTVAREFAGSGITCNSIAPGFIKSDMTAKLSDKVVDEVLKTIPMGRMGEPEEIAGIVRFLAIDPSAGYLTGQCLSPNGGMVM